jgi:hypothetical protein
LGREIAEIIGRAAPLLDEDMLPGNVRLGAQIQSTIDARLGIGLLDPFELPIVVACRDRIADTLGQLPLIEYVNGMAAPQQPPVCVRPDPLESRTETIQRLAHNLTGPYGYGWVITDQWYADGVTPSAVRVVDASEAHGLYDSTGRLEDVVWNGDHLDPTTRQVSLVRYRYEQVGPPNGSTSPIGKCRRAVEYLAALWQMAGSFWEAGFPSVALVLDQALTGPQRTQLKSDLLAAFARRHEPVITDRGGRLEAVGSNPVEAQLVESITAANIEVARAFGITPSLLNIPTGYSLTYSTTEGELSQWLKLGLSGYTSRIEAVWSDLRPYGREVRFDASVLLRTDLAARFAAYDIAYGKWMARSEIRTAEGWTNPMPDDGTPDTTPSPVGALEPGVPA